VLFARRRTKEGFPQPPVTRLRAIEPRLVKAARNIRLGTWSDYSDAVAVIPQEAAPMFDLWK
jgi:hypothetical protein